jgi:hypothetical protein
MEPFRPSWPPASANRVRSTPPDGWPFITTPTGPACVKRFEKTWTYAGDELFAEAVSAFLDEHQSTFANLRWFGADFPALLQARLPDYPELAELALFEWTLGLAFDAPDAAVADAATYRELDAAGWEQLQLQLHPSVHLLPMWTNAVALWQALGAGDEPPDAVTLDAPVVWMVWRRGLQPHFRSLGALEARALAAAIAGQTFGQMCEHAGAIEADAPQAMGQCLRSWFEQEVLRC